MATSNVSVSANNVSVSATGVVPSLQQADVLSREEFERRYTQLPHLKKAELVEGVVYMPSPVSTEKHGAPHAHFMGWLAFYTWHTSGIGLADNATLRLDWDNELQPDAMLRILPECGGQSRDEDGYVALAPEWIGEIAATSASYDLHDKKDAYRRNGVREYVVWRVEEKEIDWFVLRGGRYDCLPSDDDGIVRSQVFPGLWFDVGALLSGDMRRVLAVVQRGIDSAEHAKFLQELKDHSRQT